MGPGANVLEGGDGADLLTGDVSGAAAPDVLDGGPGYDTLSDCGPGQDRAVVDAIDVVAADCEAVERAGGSGAPAKGGKAVGPRMVVTAPGRLRRTLRHGLVVRVSGMRAGPLAVRARLGRRLVARGTVKVGRSGTATVRLRFTRAARRTLARRRAVRLTVKAGSLTRTIALER